MGVKLGDCFDMPCFSQSYQQSGVRVAFEDR